MEDQSILAKKYCGGESTTSVILKIKPIFFFFNFLCVFYIDLNKFYTE